MRETRVLGVRVDCVDMAAALARIEAFVDAGGRHLVATVNPEFVMRAFTCSERLQGWRTSWRGSCKKSTQT